MNDGKYIKQRNPQRPRGARWEDIPSDVEDRARAIAAEYKENADPVLVRWKEEDNDGIAKDRKLLKDARSLLHYHITHSRIRCGINGDLTEPEYVTEDEQHIVERVFDKIEHNIEHVHYQLGEVRQRGRPPAKLMREAEAKLAKLLMTKGGMDKTPAAWLTAELLYPPNEVSRMASSIKTRLSQRPKN